MPRLASAIEPVAIDGSNRSLRKRRAILEAATEVFLRSGYLGTNMDEIAALSEVSKQTVYKHFASKEALFVEIVTSMTGGAGDAVHNEVADRVKHEPSGVRREVDGAGLHGRVAGDEERKVAVNRRP